MRRLGTVVAALAVLMAGSAVAAAPASAGVYRTTYQVNVKSTTNNYRGAFIMDCSASKGGRCTITKSLSATRTINLSLGVSRGVVAGGLGWSSASTTTVSGSCTSPPFSASHHVYKAYVKGTQKTYTVTKRIYLGTKLLKTETSGTLKGFNPTGIICFYVIPA